MPQLGLRRRLSLLFILVIALMATLVHFVRKSLNEAESDARWLSHSHQVREAAAQIASQLRHAVGNQRAYLLTGARPFLTAFLRLQPKLETAQQDLAALVDDDPEQALRVQRLAELIAARVQQLEEAIDGRDRDGLDAVRDLIAREDRMILEGELDALFAQIQQQEAKLLQQRQRRSADSQERSQQIAAGAIAFSALLLIAAFALIYREQGRRLAAERDLRRRGADLQASLAEMRLLAEDLRSLAQLGERLQGCRSQEEAIAAASHIGQALLPDAAGQIYLHQASRNQFETASGWGEPALVTAASFAADACWCLRRGQTHSAQGEHANQICAHVDPASLAAAAYLCLPLFAHGENLGILHLNSWRPFDERERQLGASVAEQLSLALANLKLQATLLTQSIRDPLTGLNNRRFLEESLPRELNRAVRRGSPLAILMLDLDHFKQFNDNHGHDGGDALLVAFGRLLARLSRSEDIACRYGGEEFLLVLADTNADQALARADEIRTALSMLSVQIGRTVLPGATASIGVAVHPRHGDTPERLIARADAALYAAKHAGRNRTMLADGTD